MNYYVVLGVPQNADTDSIRRSFRALARRYHPDAGEGSSAEKFRDIVTAYETLNHPTRRGYYDRTLLSRRAPRPSGVEPLTAHAAPEPMLSRRDIAHTHSLDVPLAMTRLNELIDELFQPWEELLCGDHRRRDRV
jgi:curved DNA-binding protein CbpA